MSGTGLRRRVADFLRSADVVLGGDRPWDIRVRDARFFHRVLADGSLGLGESYMDAWWECPRLDEFFVRVLRAHLDRRAVSWRDACTWLRARLFNLQRLSRAFEIGRRHYDLGDELFRAMLDPQMIYSCGYWAEAATLAAAQQAKLELIARKLGLQPGMRVLDIGCGWGGTARFLAARYGVHVVGITVSQRQAAWAADCCRGLPVEIKLQDYRNLRGVFDRALSVGMLEHVGPKNYGAFLRTVRDRLRRDGLFLLHTIGYGGRRTQSDRWIARYIFPNSALPSAEQIAAAAAGRFVIEDWQNFGADYDRTLTAWCENFRRHWPALRERYGERFRRMWEYYLLSCAGAFRARQMQVWQLVLSPEGVPGGYRAPR